MSILRVLALLVWIVYGLGVLMYAVLAKEDNRILIFKEPATDKILKDHVIRTVKVTDEGSWRVKCYLEPNCVSVNVGPQEKGSHVCELNNATDESPTLSKLRKRKSYTYHGIENPCHSNPCPRKGSICQVGFTKKGFRCVCREGYKEKQCGKDCQEALVMQNGAICDRQITASSQRDANHAARQGRLNIKANGNLKGAWSAANNDEKQWLQIYLGSESIIITSVATQGGNGLQQWVTEYNVQYSDHKENFWYYTKNGGAVVEYFAGNKDENTVVYHNLSQPIKARYIRFRPVRWHGRISMRVEIYGCSEVCPSYWKMFGTSTYAVFLIERYWKEAEAFCKAMDAGLTKIDSEDESSFINTIVPNVNWELAYWIGLTDAEVGNHWKWSDESPLGLYTKWGPGEPNDYKKGKACVRLFKGAWYDYPCSNSRFRFICEK